VDARHDLVRRFRPAFDDGDLVLVAGRRQPGVAVPSVGVNHRTGHHGILDEGAQAVPGHILDAPKAAADAAASLLGRHHNDGLGLDFPASLALFRAADIGFVDLDGAREPIPAGSNHRPAQFVEPRPGCLVATQPKALTPFFWLVTNHIAGNHIRNGLRVPSKIVPADSDVSPAHARQ